MLWVVLGSVGQFLPVLDSFRQFWAVLGSSGQFWASFGQFWAVWTTLASFGLVLDEFGPLWTISDIWHGEAVEALGVSGNPDWTSGTAKLWKLWECPGTPKGPNV